MRFPGTRIAALLVWALTALPVLFAQEVAVGGFVRLDHYGGVAEESFYTNERIRLTALSQLRADDEAGFWSAFLEVVAHLQYDEEGFSVAPGALTARDIDDMIRRAYVSLRFDAFDVEVGKKFVHWGKVDFLSPLDVINHVNLEVPALGDLFEGPLADPLLHVTAYPTDDLAIELVYVPFLAPYRVTVDEFDIDFQFGLLDIDMAFRTPEVQPFSEYAHSIHGAVSYSTFLADLQVSYSWFRDQIPDIDLSGLEERIDVLHEIEGTIVPAYGRAHNIGLGASVGLDGWVISADVGAKFHQDNLDGSRIDVKNPEIRSVLQVDHPFAIGQQQLFATAGVIHRLVLFDEDAWESDYSPFLESIIGSLHDRELFQREPSAWYLISRLQTSFLREQLSVEATGVWGINEAALHLAPRVSYAITDTWSAAAGANLWFTLDGPDSTKTGILRRDDAKDNVFIQTTLRY